MDWLFAALLSTLLFAMVSVADKRLVADLFPNYVSFNITFGLLQFIIAPTYFIAVSLTVGFDGGVGIPWAIAAGLLWAGGLSLFFYGLSIEEVTRAAPMQSITPVFTAILAVSFFGGTVSGFQWAAILVVVAGAVMINLRPENGRFRLARRKAFLVLLASSFVLALAFIASDEATDRMNVWAVQGFRAAAMGIGVLALTWRPRHTESVVRAIRTPRTIGWMVLTEGITAPIAALAFVYALSVGEVSLVTTAIAVRPLAVLTITIALSTRYWNLLNEPLDRQTLGLKIAATVMIVGGVVALRF
ncbi:MAG: EamA family transporter [Planctomycetota bacterium]